MPDSNKIYKFYSFDPKEYWKLPFEKNQIHFDSFQNFNDTFEGFFKLTTEGSFEVRHKKLKQWFTDNDLIKSFKLNEDIDRYLENLNTAAGAQNLMHGLAEYGISCFSSKPDHILMWAHYTKSHRGFCLEFDKTLIEKNGDHDDLYFLPVEYSATIPTHSIFAEGTIDHLLKYKSKLWEYEAEIRAIKNEPGYLDFDPMAITKVIVGERFFDTPEAFQLREVIQNSAAHLTDKLALVKRSKDEYCLNLYPLDFIAFK